MVKHPPANTGGPSSTPLQGTRSHIPQLRVWMLQLNIVHAATKNEKILHATENSDQRAKVLQLRPDAAKYINI